MNKGIRIFCIIYDYQSIIVLNKCGIKPKLNNIGNTNGFKAALNPKAGTLD